jgi:drug/metabolite transporter (DMT)-like permease
MSETITLLRFKSAFSTMSLILATAIWGLTFPLIKDAVREISPFSFMAVRFCLATFALWGFCALFGKPERLRLCFTLPELRAGGLLGLLLFLGCGLQAIGIQYTTASNAGFITGMSVVLVPLIQYFRGQTQIGLNAWVGIAFAVVGLALLSMPEQLSPNRGDFWVLLCAVSFAIHIVSVAKYSNQFDPLRMTWLQVAVCGMLSIMAALGNEGPQMGALAKTLFKSNVAVAILFCALFATAFAYFLQNAFQRLEAAA